MGNKELGNGLQTTGYRSYIRHRYDRHLDSEHSEYELVAWIDRHCPLCGKFISKYSQFCPNCARKRKLKWQREDPKMKEERILRDHVLWHPERFNIGDYI